MTGSRVATRALRSAVQGRGHEVLAALGVPWRNGAPHLGCPYPDHADDHPSWRRGAATARARCTRPGRGSDSAFDVVMTVEDLAVAAAKRLVAGAGHPRLARRRLGAAALLDLAVGPRPGPTARGGQMTGPASGSGRRRAGRRRGGRYGR